MACGNRGRPFRKTKNGTIILAVHVDDIVVTADDLESIYDSKAHLS